MSRKLLDILKLLVSLGLMSILVRRVGLGEMYSALRQSDLGLLLVAFLFSSLGYFLQALRLRYLVERQNIKMKLIDIFKMNLISNFFGIFLPTVVGGDIVKTGLLSKYSGKKAVSAGTIVADRLVGVYSLTLIGFVASVFGYSLLNKKILFFAVVAFLFSLVVFLIIRFDWAWRTIWRKLKDILPERILLAAKNFVDTVASVEPSKDKVKVAFAISFLFYFTTIFSTYFISLSMDLSIDFIYFLIFVPLLSLSGMIPITISGLGVRESVSVLFFSSIGIAPQHGILLSFIPFLIKVFFSLVGGVIYLTDAVFKDSG